MNLTIHRERIWTAWWADQGLLWHKTALKGDGQAVLSVDGPVQEVELVNDRLVADGPFVIARDLDVGPAADKVVAELLAVGPEAGVRLQRHGKLLLCTTSYWRQRMQKQRRGNAAAYA